MGSGLLTPWHLGILLVVALLVFGPAKLPELGRSLGKGMREFKEGLEASHDDPARATTERRELPPAAPAPTEPPGRNESAGTPR